MMMQLIDRSECERWLAATLGPMLAKLLDKAEIARIEPVLCTIEDATVICGRSKRFIIDALARGLFQGKKSDGRTLIVVQSLKDYCMALPAAKGTLNRRTSAISGMGRGTAAGRARQERARAKAA
jgi:hypothetical protein